MRIEKIIPAWLSPGFFITRSLDIGLLGRLLGLGNLQLFACIEIIDFVAFLPQFGIDSRNGLEKGLVLVNRKRDAL